MEVLPDGDASPIELLSQEGEEEAATAASAPPVSRRIRLVIGGQTRVLRWCKGTTTSELLQNVRDLAHLDATTAFRLRDTATHEFVELTPSIANGATLEVVEQVLPAAGALGADANVVVPLLPPSWSKVRSDEDPPAAVELNKHTHEEVWSSLSASLSCVGEVTKIVRCESSDLWSTFLLEKKKLLKQFRARAAKEQRSGEWRCGPGCWASGAAESTTVPGPAEERLLYHTANASVDAIFQEGFDLRLASAGNFGKGIYFSDDPKKCDHYWRGRHSDAPSDGARVMFVAQVLLGETKVYNRGQTDRGLVREPERNGNQCSQYRRAHQHSTDRFDSVQGFIGTADEYIIYQNGRAYPLYAVTYKPNCGGKENYTLPARSRSFGARAGSFRAVPLRTPAPASVSVKFVNPGSQAVSLRWIPAFSTQSPGQETKIEPGKDVCIRTFDTHVWEVRKHWNGRKRLNDRTRAITIDAVFGASQTIDVISGLATSSATLPSYTPARQEQAPVDQVVHNVMQQTALKYFMEQTGEVLEARATRLLRMHNGDAAKAIAAWRKEKGVLQAGTPWSNAAPVASVDISATVFTTVQIPQIQVLGRLGAVLATEAEIRSFFLFAVVPAPKIVQVKIEGTQAFVEFSTAAEARQALKKSGDTICIEGQMHTVEVFASKQQLVAPPQAPVSSSCTTDLAAGHPQPLERPPETTVPDWNVEWSAKWHRWYWWHTKTRETSWTDPGAAQTTPALALDGQQQGAQPQTKQQVHPSLLANPPAVLDLTADDDSEDNDNGKDDDKDEEDRAAAPATTSGEKDSMLDTPKIFGGTQAQAASAKPTLEPLPDLSPVKQWNADDVIEWDQVGLSDLEVDERPAQPPASKRPRKA